MEYKKESGKLHIQEDGVYFLVDHYNFNIKKEIIDIINKYNIEDVDYLSIENAIFKKEKMILISTDIEKFYKNKRMRIDILESGLFVKVKFFEPLAYEEELTKEHILYSLYERGIRYGIDFSLIDEFLETKNYAKEYILAKGTLPEESKDGYIHFFVDINKKSLLPKILNDGSLDYKNLNLFEMIDKNQPLAEKKEGIIGECGTDVFGEKILSRIPLEPPELPAGKNTFISEDGRTLIAKRNGRVLYQNKKIDVLPILEILDGVNNSTGNIKFNGHILIHGVVLSGFIVEAEGNIEVRGSIEAATINSGGSILVTKGIHANADINAKKNINAQFIENANINATENIIANYILQGNTKCGGHLKLIGEQSRIVGGKAVIGGDFSGKYIGSSMSVKTEINVGVNPLILKKYEDISKEIKNKYERYDELEKIISVLSRQPFDKLSKEKKILFEESFKEKLEIKELLTKLKKELNAITYLFTRRMGKLEVYSTVYSGTKIIANNAVLFIKEDLKNCVIKNVNGQVMIFR